MTDRARSFLIIAKGSAVLCAAASLCLIAISSAPNTTFVRIVFAALIVISFATTVLSLVLGMRAHTESVFFQKLKAVRNVKIK